MIPLTLTRAAAALVFCLWAAASARADVPPRLKSRNLGRAARLRTPLVRLTPGASHYLVTFTHPPTGEDRDRLSARDIRIVGALPGQGYVVAAPDAADWTGVDAAWMGRLEAADKVSAEVGLASGPPAFVVEVHLDVNLDAMRAVVLAYGLTLREHPDLLPHQLLVEGDLAQVVRLAVFDEVAYIFPAAPDLLDGAPVVACAGAVSTAGFIGQYVKVGDGWARDSTGYARLGVVWGPLTEKLPAATAQAEIQRALDEWAKNARVRFQPADNAQAGRTISLFFAAGPHGDPYPFDGPSRVLAHTFYPSPPNPEPIAGDMHFDAEEPWDVGTGIDLYSVALHELGHALGLGHSDKPGAVMYPYYRRHTQLTEDDIAGIRELYGAPDSNPDFGANPPPPPAPTPSPLQLTIATPAASTTAASLAVAGTVSGGVAPYRVTWTSSQGGSGAAAGSPDWRVAAVPLSVGENRITVTAVDAANASVSGLLVVQRTELPPPPTGSAALPDLQVTSPASTVLATSASSIAIRGIASPSAVAVEWTNSVGGAGVAQGVAQWSIPSLPLFIGINRITIRARDAAGNAGWRSLTITRN